MPFSTTPAVASRPPWKNVTAGAITPVQLTTGPTNTATTATQITGLTGTVNIKKENSYLVVYLQADSITNSGANNVILTLWSGVVGTGTQLGQSTFGAQSSAVLPVQVQWLVPFSAISGLSTVTLNVGMHGSGAGTNTVTAGTTNPLSFWIENR